MSLQSQEKKRALYYYSYQIVDNDTIIMAELPNVYIFPTKIFKDDDERKAYAKLVRDIKKAHPYAKQIARSMIETYEFMETIPNKKAKEKHLKEAQKYIVEEYKPKMKKMTKNQGKILVKLIDRETNSSAYEIIKAIIGPLKATLYNSMASVYGNNLKKQYDPDGADKDIERILIEIRQGTL